MMAHSTRQHATFDITTLAHEIFRQIAMADALDILLDDRTLVEIRSDVMGCRADQFYTACMRLLVRVGALEARQEGMVDIDAAAR